MKDDKELTMDILDVVELLDEIDSIERIVRDKMIEFIKDEMTWARLKYDEGGYDYAERIEFADFYFKLNDILEVYEDDEYYRVREVEDLKLKIDRAYSDLRSSVQLWSN